MLCSGLLILEARLDLYFSLVCFCTCTYPHVQTLVLGQNSQVVVNLFLFILLLLCFHLFLQCSGLIAFVPVLVNYLELIVKATLVSICL